MPALIFNYASLFDKIKNISVTNNAEEPNFVKFPYTLFITSDTAQMHQPGNSNTTSCTLSVWLLLANVNLIKGDLVYEGLQLLTDWADSN